MRCIELWLQVTCAKSSHVLNRYKSSHVPYVYGCVWHCNTLQHTAKSSHVPYRCSTCDDLVAQSQGREISEYVLNRKWHVLSCDCTSHVLNRMMTSYIQSQCNTATHCNTLQHTATHSATSHDGSHLTSCDVQSQVSACHLRLSTCSLISLPCNWWVSEHVLNRSIKKGIASDMYFLATWAHVLNRKWHVLSCLVSEWTCAQSQESTCHLRYLARSWAHVLNRLRYLS